MNWLKKHLIKIGLALMVAGFVYEMFFAGFLKPDAPEKTVIAYNRNEFIALTTMQIGLAVLVVGILIRLFTRKRANIY